MAEPVDEPTLPEGDLEHADLTDHIGDLRAALRVANDRLRAIGALQPAPPP